MRYDRPWSIGLIALLALALSGAVTVQARAFPELIPLPTGWQPEGVALGRGTTIYAGSLATGAIYAADLRTGAGRVLIEGQPGRVAVGLAFDRRSGYLYVAGGPTGQAYVYDVATGATVASYQLAPAGAGFINDVIVTRQAAYFTNSAAAELYRLPLERDGQPADSAQTLPLSGDFAFVPNAFNANGIEAMPNGKVLIIVHSALGALYRVDPASGVATRIDLGGATLTNGDGILLHGKTLYVVQNRLNQIAVVRLSRDLGAGQLVTTITHPNFNVPTTIARFGAALYAVNAKFGINDPQNAGYEIVRVELPRGPGSGRAR
ncbi:hypothetical protein [Kallotenue papyrolyticum]|uniref:hypothetical protein n=1 Tax=Kallotenue papyrolyticum TaxID=1325125 RepID=UPI000492BCCE|nr:hypothetical protein [Kallotenue papyrolyticum]